MADPKINSAISPKLLRNQLVILADLEDFKKDLLLAIARLIEGKAAKSPKKWLKSYEVKSLLNISNGKLRAMRMNGTLPFTKIGNLIYYDFDDLTAQLSSRKNQLEKGESSPNRLH
jgi:hypothetical protein